jgi:hypothetical protein
MNCWGHGENDACVSTTCENCGKMLHLGCGIRLCEACSISLQQCQSCRKSPTWNPETIINDMNSHKNSTQEYIKDVTRCAELIERYDYIIQNIRTGSITCNAQVVQLLKDIYKS